MRFGFVVLPIFLSIGFVTAQQAPLTGPLEGFTFDVATRSIRPVIGSLGSASLGQPIFSAAYGSTAPRQDYALAFQRDHCTLLQGLGSGQPSLVPVPGSFSLPEGVSWSGDGGTAVLYSRTGNWIQVLSGLPAAVNLGPSLSLSALGGSLSAVVVDLHGERVIAGMLGEGSGVYQVTNAGTFIPLLSGLNPLALAVAADGNTLYALDSATSQVVEQNLANSSFQTWPLDGLVNPVALIAANDTNNRAVLYVAGGSDQLLKVFDASTHAALASVTLNFQPNHMDPLGSGSFLFNSRQTSGDVLWSFTNTPQPAVYFVPAAPLQLREKLQKKMRRILIGRSIVLYMAFAAAAYAQQIPFQLVATVGGNAATVQNGGNLAPLNGAVGQTQTALVKATYTGSGQITISQQPTVIGSTAFTSSIAATPPITLNPGGAVSFTIQFKPTSAAQATAAISLPFTEATGAGSTATTSSSAINLSVTGTAPNFVLSYVLQTDQNVVALAPGGSIPFAPTPINTTAQATLNLSNNGSGPGMVTGITISGTAFRITGRPALPFALSPGQTLPITVLYQPSAVSSDTGQIQVTFDSGSPVTINLEGSGSSPSFTYQTLQTNPPTTIPSGGTISFPDTNLGQTSSIVLRILNSGNAPGTVNTISFSGQAYQLGNPLTLPQTLQPNGSLTLTINFSPTLPGTQKGSLFINSDTLLLSGVGLGPQLTLSYSTAGTTVTLNSTNNSVIFSPTTISQSTQVSFDVKNTGTLATTISNIGIGQTNSPYVVSGLPPLPLNLAPNADARFNITFTPTALGFANGTLQLDSTTVALVGSGTQPPPLPSYVIGGASGTVAAGSQPNISLTLASGYPVALSGVLSVAASGNLPADPAVQFASGGQTVPFTIPANSTSAVFGTQGTQIGLQTGTVAGTLTLTPTFSTLAGGVAVLPSTSTSLQLTIAPTAPTLLAISLSNQTTNSFLINVTGFTTTRTLATWNVQFTPAPGFTIPVTNFAIDVSQIATVWFQSAASKTFGSQFTLSIPFTFQGTPPNGATLLNSIASVAVTVSNGVGTSNSIQVSAH